VQRLQRELKAQDDKYQTMLLKHEQAAQEKTLTLLGAMTSGTLDQAEAEACTSSAPSPPAEGSSGAATGKKERGGAGGGGGCGGSAFSAAMMERLRIQQQEIQRLAAVAEERNELMRMQEEARLALEEKDKELEEVRRMSSGAKAMALPKKKLPPKHQVETESESEEEDFEEEYDESASDDEWMPSAAKKAEAAQRAAKAAAAAAVRRGRKSGDSAADEGEDSPVAAAPAPKGRGAGGAKGKAKEADGEEQEWEEAEEMIPSFGDLQAMKVPALKDLCARHGLKKGGKKDELVQRLHDKAVAAQLPGGGGGGGGGAAVMSIEQEGEQVKYKVKLGKAGAVMMEAPEEEHIGSPPRREHPLSMQDDDEVELGEVLQLLESPPPVNRRRTGPHMSPSHYPRTDTWESEVAPAPDANTRPVLAKNMSRTPPPPAAQEANVEALAAESVPQDREGDWVDGAQFVGQLEAEAEAAEEVEAHATALSERENDFAVAIQQMQSYIDITARKHQASSKVFLYI
jgi:hypothetical protein